PTSSVTWRKGIIDLQTSQKYEISQKGTVLQLLIKDLKENDSDIYTCDIGDSQSSAKLVVQGRIGGAKSDWFQSCRNKTREKGPVAELVIRDVKLSDAGEYICKSGDLKTSARVEVTGRRPLLTLAGTESGFGLNGLLKFSIPEMDREKLGGSSQDLKRKRVFLKFCCCQNHVQTQFASCCHISSCTSFPPKPYFTPSLILIMPCSSPCHF
uniref:Ig-like domain-containing protein n=1 Tax=Laticauda laticaudata TaxID=8630 RepID=A0A8C5S890_LATLA